MGATMDNDRHIAGGLRSRGPALMGTRYPYLSARRPQTVSVKEAEIARTVRRISRLMCDIRQGFVYEHVRTSC